MKNKILDKKYRKYHIRYKHITVHVPWLIHFPAVSVFYWDTMILNVRISMTPNVCMYMTPNVHLYICGRISCSPDFC